MSRERLGQYMEAQQLPRGRGRRTSEWRILNAKHGSDLGHVEWYGPWRRYTFTAAPGAIFDAECLREIAGFLERKNAEHKARRKEVAHGPV